MSVASGLLEIVLVVFLVNLRYIIMTYSLLPITSAIALPKRIMIFAGITDENYALISLTENPALKTWGGLLGLVLFCYFSWLAGTIAGVSLASAIPGDLTNSMGIAIYALLIGLLVQALLRHPQYLYVVLIAMAINMLLANWLGASVALLTSIVLAPLLFTIAHQARIRK